MRGLGWEFPQNFEARQVVLFDQGLLSDSDALPDGLIQIYIQAEVGRHEDLSPKNTSWRSGSMFDGNDGGMMVLRTIKQTLKKTHTHTPIYIYIWILYIYIYTYLLYIHIYIYICIFILYIYIYIYTVYIYYIYIHTYYIYIYVFIITYIYMYI